MKQLADLFKRLFAQFLLIICIYFISRVCFTLIHLKYFAPISIGTFLSSAFAGIRFDAAAFFVVNAPYILLLFFIPQHYLSDWQHRFTQKIFLFCNTIAFLFEFSDWAYFPFNNKRSTADVLDMIGRKSDFLTLLPRFLISYWYVPLALVIIIIAFIKVNSWICRKTPINRHHKGFSWKWHSSGIILISAICILCIRGGAQLIPIGIRNAVAINGGKYAPIVLNTPFSIITTYNNDILEEVRIIPEATASQLINPIKHFSGKQFKDKNVVIIILESFSKEFTCLGEGPSYTPFLDSLMGEGLVCTNAYANGYRSAEGIPAILAGIPSLQEEPFTTSPYGVNRITSIPNQLAQKGYASAFYHGGNYGTMSFDLFTANAGIKRYKGREDYPDASAYDGHWGIWDEPFLQYSAADITKNLKEPFCATLFTLTSHFPYRIPESYKNQFPKGTLDIHESIGYTDFSLRQFFQTIKKEKWFTNTVFVIVPDHCSSLSNSTYYTHNQGRYAIPILYYAPSDTMLKGIYEPLTQQIDILPSLLDYLGYEQPFFAFGNSIFNTSAPKFATQFQGGSYNWMMDEYLSIINNNATEHLYHFKTDSTCYYNLYTPQNIIAKKQFNYAMAFRQTFNHHMINNTLWVR